MKISYPTTYLDDDACIGNKRVRQYGGLVNLEWMTNQKLENLWTRVDYV
jgi:hypothetical protein